MPFRTRMFVPVLLIAVAGCGDDDAEPAPTSSDESRAALALVRAIQIDGGEQQDGKLALATESRVSLLLTSEAEAKPGEAGLLPFEIDNPIEDDNATVAVLMQFGDVDEHVRVPETPDDAGKLELEFEIDSDVCESLCNTRIDVPLTVALELDDGAISKHLATTMVVDCRADGDPDACEEPEPEPSKDAGSTDEPDGSVPVDPEPMYTCDDGDRIAFSQRCDGTDDCADASDEDGCTSGGPGLTSFPCTNGSSLTLDKLCDGTNDCPDGLDEMICGECQDGSGRFSSFQVCDGKDACEDGSDEAGCMYPCGDGEMVPYTDFCNGTPDCTNGSDESLCSGMGFKCLDGEEIPLEKVCNDTEDCENGGDEANYLCGG